jgi:gluconokinase
MSRPSRLARPIVLALDLGTSSVRTALFDDAGQAVRGSLASRSYHVHYLSAQGAELDPMVLLRATKACLRQTHSHAKADSIGLVAGSGFWHSLLALDHAAKPLTPIYTWADARGTDDAASLRRQLDERTVHQRTGCMLRASFWPAKLAWLRRTQPRLFCRVARWVSPAEWIFEQIFSVRACSHSMASGTGLYDSLRYDWDDELLSAIGLERSQLNPLSDKVEATGRTFFSPIGDGAAGNLGSGASKSRLVALNIGTSAALRAILRGHAPLPFGLFRFVVDEKRLLLGGAVSNAGNLRAWCLRELRLPNDRYSLEKILRRSASALENLTILPFLVSERAPTWPEHLAGAIYGLTQATTAADLLQAATAAVGHRLAQILAQLETVTGRAGKIIVSGGVLQSPATLKILADSLGRDLEVCAEQETSLRGAAVHALEKSGRKIQPLKFKRRIPHDRSTAFRNRQRGIRQEYLETLLANMVHPV